MPAEAISQRRKNNSSSRRFLVRKRDHHRWGKNAHGFLMPLQPWQLWAVAASPVKPAFFGIWVQFENWLPLGARRSGGGEPGIASPPRTKASQIRRCQEHHRGWHPGSSIAFRPAFADSDSEFVPPTLFASGHHGSGGDRSFPAVSVCAAFARR